MECSVLSVIIFVTVRETGLHTCFESQHTVKWFQYTVV